MNEYMGVEPKIGGNPPKWMVYFMENPMNKCMIWGVLPPLFLEGHPYRRHALQCVPNGGWGGCLALSIQRGDWRQFEGVFLKRVCEDSTFVRLGLGFS